MEEKVQLQNEFWVIEVTNQKNEVGFIINTVDGIKVSIGFDVKTTMFKTRSAANDFINQKKLYKSGKVRIVNGTEIAQKFGTVADDKRDLWLIKNEEGLYLKYSAEKNVGYYFDKEKLGAVMFDDIIHMGKFIECWQPQFNVSKFIPILMKDDKDEKIK